MKYKEHEKLEKVKDDSQKLGYFLEWLQSKYVFAKWDKHDNLQHAHIDINRLLSEYFKIDYDKLQDEKDQILADYRKAHP